MVMCPAHFDYNCDLVCVCVCECVSVCVCLIVIHVKNREYKRRRVVGVQM